MTPEEAEHDARDRLIRLESAVEDRLLPDVMALRADFQALVAALPNQYVTLVQYRPYEAAIKYFIMLICGSVIAAAVALVVGNR